MGYVQINCQKQLSKAIAKSGAKRRPWQLALSAINDN